MPAKRSLTLALALLLVAAIPVRATGFPAITVVDSIRPGIEGSYALRRVSRLVSNARNEGPECLAEAGVEGLGLV